MFLNFRAVVAALGQGAAFRIANGRRPPGDYLFNTLLPEELRFSYSIESGQMIVRSTMAGLAAMDSPYPPGGVVETSTFLERSAKLANQVPLSEQTLRTLQEMLMRLQVNGQPTNQAAAEQALNFLDKVIIQPHIDVMEWLRSRALVYGAINWTFNRKTLVVNYGVPSGNFLTARTGTAHYGGSASAFWTDIKLLRQKLKSVRAYIAHPTTIDLIRYNTVNSVVTVAEDANGVTLRRIVSSTGQFTQDAGDVLRIVSYDKEGEILDPTDPDSTVIIPFMPPGKLLAVGNNQRTGFAVGVARGSTDNPQDDNRLGYTHIAPTVEGGGAPGRWANLYTPENEPWQLIGRGVTNGLPVIEAPEKIAVATTDLA